MSENETPVRRCPKCGAELQQTQGAVCPRCALGDALGGFDEEQGAEFLALHDIPPPGQKVSYIGDYEIIDVIAKGGMGVVYRARQRSLNRMVALKMLLGGVHASDDFKRRFRQEAEAAAKLQHSNIVPIYEVGEHEGHQFFSMKLVEGDSLAQQIAGGRWKINESNRREQQQAIARLIGTIAGAVHHAHQRGVLHRDLKPSNILLDEEGQPHVTDFGLARLTEQDSDLTESGAVMGTPSYMAPEQAEGKTREITTAADIYAVGAMLYELLAGERPFQASGKIEVLRMVAEQEPPRPRTLNPLVDRDLETVCLKCLEKEPNRRYLSLLALLDDLDGWLHGTPISARPAGSMERMWKLVKRRPGISSLTLVLFLTVCSAFGLMVAQVSKTDEARRDAVANLKQTEVRTAELEDSYAVISRILNQIVISSHNAISEGHVTQLVVELTSMLSTVEKSPRLKFGILQSIAYSYSAIEEIDSATSYNRQALGIAKQTFGDDSVEVAEVMDALADLALRTGDVTNALRFSRNALAMFEKHPDVYSNGLHHVYFRLGLALQEEGELDQAASAFQAGLQQLKRANDVDTGELKWCYSLLSRLELKRHNYSRAEEFARQALAMDNIEPDGWLAAHCNTLLGDCLTERKQLSQAEALLTKGCEILIEERKHVWLKRLLVPEAISRLIRHYSATGQAEKRSEWQARLDRVKQLPLKGPTQNP